VTIDAFGPIYGLEMGCGLTKGACCGIDMTKVLVEPIGRVSVIIVLDWYRGKGHRALCRAVSQGQALDVRR